MCWALASWLMAPQAPPSLLPAFHPLTTVPRCSKQVVEEDWGHTSTPGGISGQTMTKAGGRHLGVNCEWLARARISRESVSPTQPWSRYHTPPEGRAQDACMSSCVSLQKSDAPGSTSPDLALSQGRAERTGCWEEVKEAAWQSVGLRYLWGSTLSSPIALYPGGNLLFLLPSFLSLGCIYLIWPVLRALWKNEFQIV